VLLDLAEMTAAELRRLDPARTCFFIVVGPVEQHGPHLPLGTDIFEAEGVARRLAARLAAERPDWTWVFHPSVPLGADCFRPYPGTVNVRPAVVGEVVESIAVSLAESGFTRFIVASHHGGPGHNLALERAARRVRRRTRGRAALLSLAGRTIVDLYFNGGLAAHHERMADDEKTRRDLAVDCHAGAFETSEMLALRPDLVRDFAALEPVLVPLEKLSPKAAKRAGRGLGYFGAPALATKERGERYLDLLVERALPDVRRFLDGADVPGLSLRWRATLAAMSLFATIRDMF
jgi:creatinine amidohydrolase